jgi:hypothetical protein
MTANPVNLFLSYSYKSTHLEWVNHVSLQGSLAQPTTRPEYWTILCIWGHLCKLSGWSHIPLITFCSSNKHMKIMRKPATSGTPSRKVTYFKWHRRVSISTQVYPPPPNLPQSLALTQLLDERSTISVVNNQNTKNWVGQGYSIVKLYFTITVLGICT